VNGFPQPQVVGSHSPSQEVKDTQGQKPFHSCAKKLAGNRLTEKLTRQDATDPKEKAVTDYKEQGDRHHPPPPTAGKLKA